jgi:hypothetical protein
MSSPCVTFGLEEDLSEPPRIPAHLVKKAGG